MLSEAPENALAQCESTLLSSRRAWMHMEVHRGTGEVDQSFWEVCVCLPDQFTFCWCSDDVNGDDGNGDDGNDDDGNGDDGNVMMTLVMVIIVPEALRQVARLYQYQHPSFHKLRALHSQSFQTLRVCHRLKPSHGKLYPFWNVTLSCTALSRVALPSRI